MTELRYGDNNIHMSIDEGSLDQHAFMRACREGGRAIEQALRLLDRAFFAVLYRESFRIVRDAEGARDIVQETFIKVWQRCATFKGDSELLPWMRAILRRGVLDRLRRPDHETPLETGGAMSAATERRIAELSEAQVPTPVDGVRAQELADCFQRCWERFERDHPSHAAVIAWIVEDELSNEQISELLDRTPGATREFISQCRKRARVYFAEWYTLAFGVAASA
ncbi:MAG: sigma-70 family RNA polymerase sigma factor [Gammaproteobacteria bacterium]